MGEPTNVQKYTYMKTGWNDLLHTYNNRIVTHDDLGNPLRYRDNLRFTWVGRLMATAKTSATTTSSYSYAQSGLRLKKEYQDGTEVVTHTYDYDGTLLVREKYGDTTLWFMYDESGSPVGLRRYVNGAYYIYYYVKNAQGDIVGITNSAGQVAVKYTYDSWGKVLSVTTNTGTAISPTDTNHIANINPLRYRGYYYDTETGLYYLQSRYYDPVTGRFVNADSLVTDMNLLATNLFSYCMNNPIRYADESGTLPDDRLIKNAELYKLGWNFSLCGQSNNYNNTPKEVIQTKSEKNVIIYENGVTPGSVVENDPNNIVVIDGRKNWKNPDIQIKNSYKIFDKKLQNEVIDVLYDYNDRNPTKVPWRRSRWSMIIEWDLHTALYSVGYEVNRTADVDLDNNDEGFGLLWR